MTEPVWGDWDFKKHIRQQMEIDALLERQRQACIANHLRRQ